MAYKDPSLTLRTLDNFNINLLHSIYTLPDESGALLNQLTVFAVKCQSESIARNLRFLLDDVIISTRIV